MTSAPSARSVGRHTPGLSPRAAPALAITRQVLRRSWKGALTVGVTFAAVAAASAASYVKSFPTEASRHGAMLGMADDRGLAMAFGSISRIDTVGGYTAYKTYVFLTSIGVVWAVMVTSRFLRGEEESGRWSLLLAGKIDAAGATAATVVGLLADTIIVGAVTALGVLVVGRSSTISFGAPSALAFGAATVLPSAVFVGVAAVASQLARSRHLANAIALGVFTVTFVLRMLGDSTDRMHWLLWTTPLGWAEVVHPLTDDAALPLVAGLIAAVAGCLGAVWLAGRRDVGDAVISSRPSRPPRRTLLGSPTALAGRLAAPLTVAWTLGLVGTAIVFGSITQTVVRALEATSGTTQMLEKLVKTGHGSNAYLAVAFVLLGTILALVPAHHVAMARDEEQTGRLALVLTGQINRRRWLGGRLGLGAGVIVVLGPLTGIAFWIAAVSFGADVALWPAVEAGLLAVPAALVALAVGSAVFAFAPRAAPASVELLVGWSLVIDLLGSFVAGFEPLARLSLFHFAPSVPASAADLGACGVMIAIAVAVALLAVVTFERRDLAFD